MNLKQYRDEVDAIRLSLETVARRGADVEEIIVRSITHVLECGDRGDVTGAEECALIHLMVYLSMGYPYGLHKELFDKILEKTGLNLEDLPVEEVRERRVVRANKGQIRNMIGRWGTCSRNTMTVSCMVEDILNKVKMGEDGVHYYKSYTAGNERPHDIYELVIRDGRCYFRDIRRERYYHIQSDLTKKVCKSE